MLIEGSPILVEMAVNLRSTELHRTIVKHPRGVTLVEQRLVGEQTEVVVSF